jgi:hypothetical protein
MKEGKQISAGMSRQGMSHTFLTPSTRSNMIPSLEVDCSRCTACVAANKKRDHAE